MATTSLQTSFPDRLWVELPSARLDAAGRRVGHGITGSANGVTDTLDSAVWKSVDETRG